MINFQALLPIGVIILSFIVGVILYYVLSILSKAEKKQQIDALISLLINFVLYIWLGKVLAHLQQFFRDPLAVLARPSDAQTLYIALILVTINILYLVVYRKVKVSGLMYTFVPVFIGASFTYEFIKIVFLSNTSTWGYLSLLLILVIGMVSLYEKIESTLFIVIIMATWIIGQFILSFLFPYIVVFTYLISILFLGIAFVLLFIYFVYNYKRIG